MVTAAAVNPWAVPLADPVRAEFERPHFDRLLARLLAAAPGGRVLDLFCGDAGLAQSCSDGCYTGVDLFPPAGVDAVRWDLRDGLGPASEQGFDVCIATFGAISHLAVAELDRLVGDVAAAAAPGAFVALEALGLHSLEWPALWSTSPGPERVLPYQLTDEVSVHPWLPGELRGMFAAHGLRWVGTCDRTVQAGPKLGRYWPGLPDVRHALAMLADGDIGAAEDAGLRLPRLPAHPAADAHRALASARSELWRSQACSDPRALARAIWALEPSGPGLGLGHGLMAVGRAP